MKIRTCLAVLSALALPLVSCTASPPQQALSRAAPLAASGTDPSRLPKALFPHDKHASELEIACVQCHHETNAGPLVIPHKKYFDDLWIDCGICHRAKGAPALEPQACSTCHHERNGNIADETLSAKVVIHKNCWSCHEVGKGAEASAVCKTCHKAGS